MCLQYATSYALQNFKKINSVAKKGELGALSEWETDNLSVIRAFEDASGSEAGFILVQ